MNSSKKVWGVFNTLDKSSLDKMSEFEVWEKIYLLNRDINIMLKYSEKPRNKDISIKGLLDEQFNLEYLIYYTRKFGVKFDKEPVFGKHIQESESFNSWYKYWNNHFKNIKLNDNQKKAGKENSDTGNTMTLYGVVHFINSKYKEYNNRIKKSQECLEINEDNFQLRKVY